MIRKSIVWTHAALFVVVAGYAEANIPCIPWTVCVGEVMVNSPCADADAKFSYGQAWDEFLIRVTVLNCLQEPVDECVLRLDYGGSYEAQAELGSGMKCALSGTGSATAVTGITGAAVFTLIAGGSGELTLNYTVTAECAAPEIQLCEGTGVICFKSTDLNGDGSVNFLDAFKYLPQLLGNSGWSGDLNCADPVNFFDNFAFLPDLLGLVTLSPLVSIPDGPGTAPCGP